MKVLCLECGHRVKFLLTSSGRYIAVNEESVEDCEVQFEPGCHVAHFNCDPYDAANDPSLE